MKLYRRSVLAGAAALSASPKAFAQAYPSKPIKIVVPFAAGSATDLTARGLAAKLQELLKQPIVVDDKPGASGQLGASAVATAPPDGYTLLMGTNTTNAANPALFKKLSYDPEKDFVPIMRCVTGVNVLVVNNELPIKSVAELIDYAKKNPDQKMSFGSAGVGSAHHIAGELLKQKTGLNMVHVPYKGGGPAIQDLVAGHIPISFGTTPAVMPQAQAGTIRILALAETKRSPDLPNVPTISETVSGVITFTWVGVFAPLGTPKPIVDRVNSIIAEAVKKPDVIAKLKTQGATAAGGTPQDLQKSMQEEFDHWTKVIPSIGIKPE